MAIRLGTGRALVLTDGIDRAVHTFDACAPAIARVSIYHRPHTAVAPAVAPAVVCPCVSTPSVPTLSPAASIVSRLRGEWVEGLGVCVDIFSDRTYAKPTPPTYSYSRSRKEPSRLEGMSPATAAAAASGPTAAAAVGRGLVVCCKVYVSEVRCSPVS